MNDNKLNQIKKNFLLVYTKVKRYSEKIEHDNNHEISPNKATNFNELMFLTSSNQDKMVSYEDVKRLLEAERNREREKSEYIIGELLNP